MRLPRALIILCRDEEGRDDVDRLLPVAVAIFPVTHIISDIVTEV